MSRIVRRFGHLGVALLCMSFAQLFAPAPAAAHSEFVSSVPADGEQLSRAPRQVSIVLSETIEPRLTTVTLTDGVGRRVETRGLRVTSHAGDGPEEQGRLVVGLPALPANSYRLAWVTVSSDDLHKSNGAIVFGVGQQVSAAGSRAPDEPAPAPIEVASRWLGFLALGAALGAGALLVLLRPALGAPATLLGIRQRLRGLSVAGGGVALVSGVGLLLGPAEATDRGAGAAAWNRVTATSYGPRWLVREAGIAILLAVAFVLWRRVRAGSPLPPGRLLAPVVVPAVLAVGVASALLGHAGAAAGTAPVRVLIDAVHMIAAMLWAGSIVAAAIVLLPGRDAEGLRVAGAVLRSFAVVAIASTGLLVVTGLLLAGSGVASLDAMLLSLYGRTLLVKLALIALALAFGLINTRLVRRSRLTPLLRRTVGVEAMLACGVLLAAAFLTSSAPATGPRWRTATEGAAAPLRSATETDLVETVSIKPNRPGLNFVAVNVFDSRRPAPAPIQQVLVTLRASDGVPLQRAATPDGTGAYVVATDRIGSSGQWAITVAVVRPGLPTAIHPYSWTVAPAQPAPHPVVVSKAPLAPLVDRLALAVLGALALCAGVLVVRRRPRPPAASEPPAAVEAFVG